jgi:ribose/xylose/arabinose/galactoside ABC-type transport system permease subunit
LARRLGSLLDAGKRLASSSTLTVGLCLVYGAVMALVAPGFASGSNFSNVLLAFLPLLIVASGQTVVLVTAGIDLSVTSIIAVASITGAAICSEQSGILAGHPLALPLALLAMLVAGAFIGAFNGCCVACLGMPPFIVTLATMMFFSGLAIWWTDSQPIGNLPRSWTVLGQREWLAAMVALAAAGFVQFLLHHTLYGLGWHAVGSNRHTARVSGVSVTRLTVLAYVTSGLCAAVAAVIITGQLESASPTQWRNNLLDVIGAAVLGGASLSGGRGSVWSTAVGVVMLVLIDNSLNLLNLSQFTILIAKGSVILLAASLDALRQRPGA